MVAVTSATAVGMAVTGGLTLKYNEDFDASGHTDAGLRDSAFALRTTTDVLLGVALAAAVAATVLAFVPGEGEAEADGASGIAVGPVGLVAWW